jgi:dihydrofolate reductase
MTRNDELASHLLEQGCFPVRGLTDVASEKVNAWLIGGASLYDAALDQGLITELYVMQVHQRSNADVKVKHDLYNWKLFAVQELQRGRSWRLDEVSEPVQPDNEPKITFIKLVRML